MTAGDTPVLDEENAAFIVGGVSMSVASSDASGLPSLARAWGCRVSADRRSVTTLVSSDQAAALLTDLRNGRPVAAVFCLASRHRAIQLKARRATVADCAPEDRAAAECYARAFSTDLELLGYGGSWAAAYVDVCRGPLVAISFEPAEAYRQTPGPNAGERLGKEG